MGNNILRTVVLVIVGVIVLFGLIQLIPVNRTNPPVVTQMQWDSPQTKALFDRACSDCHSNETTWPWYSQIAPVSWLVLHDVNDGRRELNFSNLNTSSDRFSRLPDRIARAIQEGGMPPAIYLPLHPTAALTADEKQALIKGLQTTLTNMQK